MLGIQFLKNTEINKHFYYDNVIDVEYYIMERDYDEIVPEDAPPLYAIYIYFHKDLVKKIEPKNGSPGGNFGTAVS